MLPKTIFWKIFNIEQNYLDKKDTPSNNWEKYPPKKLEIKHRLHFENKQWSFSKNTIISKLPYFFIFCRLLLLTYTFSVI